MQKQQRLRQGWGSGREGWTAATGERWDLGNQAIGEEVGRNREERVLTRPEKLAGPEEVTGGLIAPTAETPRFSVLVSICPHFD